jgi:hypothetical protein
MAGPRRTEAKPPAVPRWVKISGLIVLAVILLVVVVMALAGAQHGPDRHVPGGADPGGHTAPAQPGS